MRAMGSKTSFLILKRLALPSFGSTFPTPNPQRIRGISSTCIRHSPPSQYGNAAKKASARLSPVQQLLLESDAVSAANGNIPPKICLEHVSVSFAASGGPGGQRGNKENTRVDMRFKVKSAIWLSQRIRDKILLMEKNKMNKNGEIYVHSRKTLSQQGNIVDCLSKIQAIIDAAAYVPPPLSEEQKMIVARLADMSQRKRHKQERLLRKGTAPLKQSQLGLK